MLFNVQAAISTVLFIALLTTLYIGVLFTLYHRWMPARVAGFVVAAAAFVGIVSHAVALLLGA